MFRMKGSELHLLAQNVYGSHTVFTFLFSAPAAV